MRVVTSLLRALALSGSLGGCTMLGHHGAPPLDRDFEAAIQEEDPAPVQIVSVSDPWPLPGQLMPAVENRRAKPEPASAAARVDKANATARVEPKLEGYLNAVQIYPFTTGALYQLYAAPEQVTDVALQPGETLKSVSAGDTVRWIVGDTTSGDPDGEQVHILVKPVQSGLKTNLVAAGRPSGLCRRPARSWPSPCRWTRSAA
jgi:type IV secretion system protein VirB9